MAMSAPETFVNEPHFVSFVIFHRALSPTDDEAGEEEMAEKLLYYYPPLTPLSQQLDHVQFCEGLLDFANTFTTDDCTSVRQGSVRHTFLQCEPGLWMVLTMTNPTRLGTAAGQSTGGASGNKAGALLGLSTIGGSDQPLLPETVCDSNITSAMRDAYQVYALFYGSVQRIVECASMQASLARLHKLRKDIRKASKARREWHRQSSVVSGTGDDNDSDPGSPRRRASSIMPADLEAKVEALPRLREALQVEEAASPMAHVRNVMRLFFDVWTGRLDVASLTLFHDIDGFHYLPVDRATYLKLQHFVNSLMLSLQPLHHGIFLYNGRLLFTTLAHGSVSVILKYLRWHCTSVLHRATNQSSGGTASSGDSGAGRFASRRPPVVPAFSVPPPLVAAAAAVQPAPGFQPVPAALRGLSHPPLKLDRKGNATKITGYDDPATTPTAPPQSSTARGRRNSIIVEATPHLGPRLGDGTGRLFAPPVFLDPSSRHPSHYMLWFQHGQTTILLFAQHAALNTTPRASFLSTTEALASQLDLVFSHNEQDEEDLRDLEAVRRQGQSDASGGAADGSADGSADPATAGVAGGDGDEADDGDDDRGSDGSVDNSGDDDADADDGADDTGGTAVLHTSSSSTQVGFGGDGATGSAPGDDDAAPRAGSRSSPAKSSRGQADDADWGGVMSPLKPSSRSRMDRGPLPGDRASNVGAGAGAGAGTGAGAGATSSGAGEAADDAGASDELTEAQSRVRSASICGMRLKTLCDGVLGLVTDAVPSLAKAIATAQAKIEGTPSHMPKEIARVVYYNTINGALKFLGTWPAGLGDRVSGATRGEDFSTGVVSARRLANGVPAGLLIVLNQTRQAFANSTCSVEEVVVRTRRYGNVLARKAFGRELYIVVETKTVGLIESYAKAQEILNTKFVNICMD